MTIVERISNQKVCLVVAEKLLRSLPVLMEKQESSFKASIGGSIFPKDTTALQGLIKYADAPMNSAKDRNIQICFYQESSKV